MHLQSIKLLNEKDAPDKINAYMQQLLESSGLKETAKTCDNEMLMEILTHASFYGGWPKAWAACRMAKAGWAEETEDDARKQHENTMIFPIGVPNDGFAQYFIGQSYLAPLSASQVGILDILEVKLGSELG